MTISRRGFLTAMLAAGAAPYVMSSGIGRGVLMPVKAVHVPTDAEIQAVINEMANYLYADWQRAYHEALLYGIGYMQDGSPVVVQDIPLSPIYSSGLIDHSQWAASDYYDADRATGFPLQSPQGRA